MAQRYIITFMITLIQACHSVSAIAANKEEINSLKGLTGVYVSMGPIDPAVAEHGLERGTLQGDIMLRLRQRGVAVLNAREMREIPGQPVLKVLLNIHQTEMGVYVYSLDILLQQSVKLLRKPSLQSHAITWKTGTLGIVSEDELHNVRGLIMDYIDEFAEDYKTTNPQRSAASQ